MEGRALGREKGFELWEEVGFYKGFALFWSSTSPAPADEKRRSVVEPSICTQLTDTAFPSRTVRHAVQLLHLIADFPRHNPSHLVERSQNAEDSLKGFQNSLDMTKIRSKYRLLCASLNLPTRSRESAAAAQNPSSLHYTGTGPGVLVEYEDEAERQHPRFRSGAPEVNRIWKGVEGTES